MAMLAEGPRVDLTSEETEVLDRSILDLELDGAVWTIVPWDQDRLGIEIRLPDGRHVAWPAEVLAPIRERMRRTTA